MMGVIVLLLPEMLLLWKILMPRLIAVFIGIVAGGILLGGYLFNFII